MPVEIPIINVQNVSYAYGSTIALSNVSCSIYPGEYIAIIGPNGGGKSTFLRLLLGLQELQSGSISILGKTAFEARKRGAIGYVPQRLLQSADMIPATVEEVISTGLQFVSPKKRTARLQEILTLVDIEHLRNRQCHELSGGQLQLVYMARALSSNPSLLLLDEPASGIDSIYKKQLYTILKKLHNTGTTVIFVTHEVDDILKEANQVICINKTICCHTGASDFINKHTISSLYQTQLNPSIHA